MSPRPHQVGRTGREVALQQIGLNGQTVLAVGSHDKLPLAPGLDAVVLHRPTNALLAHPDAPRQQLLPHLGPAVLLLDLGVDGPNMGQQRLVADALASTRNGRLVSALAAKVLKVATGAHAQCVACQRNRPPRFLARYPGVLHVDSLAKYAVAFFKMSRSILTRASSARSRASSI